MLIMKFLAAMHHLLGMGEGGKLQFPNFLTLCNNLLRQNENILPIYKY